MRDRKSQIPYTEIPLQAAVTWMAEYIFSFGKAPLGDVFTPETAPNYIVPLPKKAIDVLLVFPTCLCGWVCSRAGRVLLDDWVAAV